MARSSSGIGKATRAEARVKVWLEVDGQYLFGFGMSEILKAVEAAGSIKAAASRLGKSYRYVWGRIKKAETTLGQSLVKTRIGGKGASRSELTDTARSLVRDYDALRERVFEVAHEEFGHRFSLSPLSRRGGKG
jgi:molybdate transport repressor ModE-like protein